MRRTKIDLMLKQLAVDGATERTPDGWVATGAPWSYDAEHYDGVVAVRRCEADIMRAYVHGRSCLMTLLTESLTTRTNGGMRAMFGMPGRPDRRPARGHRRRGRTRRHRHPAPRRSHPGTAKDVAGRHIRRWGKIPAQLMAEPGRILAHADAPEWTDVLSGARDGDEAAVAELADAAVAALAPCTRVGHPPRRHRLAAPDRHHHRRNPRHPAARGRQARRRRLPGRPR